MKNNHGITVHWALLVIVYLAIVFAMAMVSLTSDSMPALMPFLLLAGLPVYVVASGAIMAGREPGAGEAELPVEADDKVTPFAPRRQHRADISRPVVGPRRKAG